MDLLQVPLEEEIVWMLWTLKDDRAFSLLHLVQEKSLESFVIVWPIAGIGYKAETHFLARQSHLAARTKWMY